MATLPERKIIKTLNPGVKVTINDIVYVDGRPLDIPPQYISENKYLCLDNGTILDKDIQIGELRKALEDIEYMTDPLGANGNEKIYSIALNALKK